MRRTVTTTQLIGDDLTDARLDVAAIRSSGAITSVPTWHRHRSVVLAASAPEVENQLTLTFGAVA